MPSPMRGSKAGVSLDSEWVLIAFSMNSTRTRAESFSTKSATGAMFISEGNEHH